MKSTKRDSFIDVKDALKEAEMLELGREFYDVEHMLTVASRLANENMEYVDNVYIQLKEQNYNVYCNV